MKTHKKNPGDMKAVYIEWIDSTSLVGSMWHTGERLKHSEPAIIQTVGYIFMETPKAITIVNSNGECEFGGNMCIPQCAIKKRRNLYLK